MSGKEKETQDEAKKKEPRPTLPKNVTMMRLPDGTRVPRPCNWCHSNPAENGDVICVDCLSWLRMTKDYLKKYRRDYKKTEAQARVKAGLPTPKAERTRKYQEAMARKAAKAKEPKTAS